MHGKKKKSSAAKLGLCALTGKEGKFVKSHLLPQALTQPNTAGEYFIESGKGRWPVRRFTSWYDDQLVTREGEDLLSEIDDKAIAELRRLKLVWSGWGSEKSLSCPNHMQAEGKGIRAIPEYNPHVIRIFFLSLLWRALKTRREEFSFLPSDGVNLDEIGRMIVSGDCGSPNYHAVVLHQLSTKGEDHNYSPTFNVMEIPDDGKSVSYGYYRFYIQGLIAHVHLNMDEEKFKYISGICVGCSEKLFVLTHEAHDSAQADRLKHVKIEYFQRISSPYMSSG